MTRIAPNTLGHEAVRRIAMGLEHGSEMATLVVAGDVVSGLLALLQDPDAEMLEAGIAEFQHALPPGCDKRYKRDLARCVWRAMLSRVAT
jgi:hypothetical protein